MAGRNIGQLPTQSPLQGGDLVPVWDGAATKSISITEIRNFNRNYQSTVTALTNNAGVVNIDLSLGDYFTLELTANVTSITFSNPPGSGRGFSKFIQITQTGAFTVSWPASFRWEGGAAGAVSGSAAVDLLAITSVDNGATIHATLSNDRKVPA